MDSISNSHKGEQLLRSRIEDAVRLSRKRHCASFLGFLDEKEQAEAARLLEKLSVGNYLFYGGYADCERVVLGVFPDEEWPDTAAFPLCILAFHYRSDSLLTHRDVLGTLMAAGLRRDAIGDILCAHGLAVVFLREEIAAYICDQIDRIDGESVRIDRDYSGDLPAAHTFLPISDTIASARLDAVVSVLARCSREQAAQLIRSDCVSIDHVTIHTVSQSVAVSQKISIHGYGKYVIDKIGPQTKKGRWRFLARKYV